MTSLFCALLALGAPAQEAISSPGHGHGAYVETADGRLYYEKSGEGPVVVLVAGGPGSGHSSFHGYFDRELKGRTVVFFDNIGRGRSDRLKDASGYTVERDAEDIEALRRHLGVERITVIGHSYGGMPAIAYAVKYPQHLDRLVLSDTLHSANGFQQNIDSCNAVAQRQSPEKWAKLMEMRKRGVKSSADEYTDLYGPCLEGVYTYDDTRPPVFFDSGDPQDRFNPEVYLAMLGDDPEWKVAGTMKRFDPRGRLKDLRVPTLICVGRHDQVAIPRVAYEMHKLIPGSRLHVFEKSGHWPWLEEKQIYFEVVNGFLGQS
ncbi:MAG: proline iminopeptidase-family hydrolase [Fimbriimonadaceae bacterium]|nr:proline iminopeptidase-family hydrolase [Fimbriimonadaceae bacterium]QYK56773.1 MAG: proline iminopeptidase-family hydrolase [Fimbriimonadaceae bacterium]